jgi:hypothetical protein
MKNLTIAILLITTVAFGGLYLKQLQKTRTAEATVATLKQSSEELEGRVAEQEKRTAALQTHLEDTRISELGKAAEVAQLKQTLTNQPAVVTNVVTIEAPTNARPANGFAEMFKNPEMKELIKKQQKAVMGTMIDKNYAGLFKDLHMNSQQNATLKDLITQKSMVDANMGMAMMTGDNDPDKRKEMLDQAKAEKDALNDQIKQFLGDSNYEQFQAYEKSQPDRMVLGMFKDQIASGPDALNPDQEGQLLKVMSEERQNFKYTTDYSDPSKYNGDFASAFTDEKMDQYLKENAQLTQRYLDRAKTFLSPDQYTAYDQFLSNQRDMAVAGMKMAGKMFGAKDSAK